MCNANEYVLIISRIRCIMDSHVMAGWHCDLCGLIARMVKVYISIRIILPGYTGGRYLSTSKPEKNAFYSKIIFWGKFLGPGPVAPMGTFVFA